MLLLFRNKYAIRHSVINILTKNIEESFIDVCMYVCMT